MKQKIFAFLRSYSADINKINRLLISAYVYINKITVVNNLLIKSLLINRENKEEFPELVNFISLIELSNIKFDIEFLIKLFEFVISPIDKEINGAVYTPQYIRSFLAKQTLEVFDSQNWSNLKIADISCGCGGFFLSVCKLIKETIEITYADLYLSFYGVDIEEYSVDRTKILLSLYAIQNGEDEAVFNFNLFKANSLSFDWRLVESVRENGGFDIVIGNPPYVGASKIPHESKVLLDKWSVTKTGKTDLYIPFFQIAIENLNENGVVGYITVNNFYRSLNGRAFRSYMSEHLYDFKMIDFGAEQVFKGRSTYTCICLIRKTNGFLHYCKAQSSELDKICNKDYIRFQYANLSDYNGWLLQDQNIARNIIKIESTGRSLGDVFNIRNGFATLKNDVYILNIIDENDSFYFTKTKDGLIFKIEKSICRDAIKPNTLKSEKELSSKLEKLLFPYDIVDNVVKLMDEGLLKKKFPCAYEYLLSYKAILADRDKGNRTYENWYAFGRSQALNVVGYKLLFPYIAEYPHFVLSSQESLLFYNGYALVSNSLIELRIVQKILRSKVFWYYIKHTSKPYGSDYFALAKNYVKNFGIIELSDLQKQCLLSLKSEEKINQYLMGLYGVDL